MEMIFSDVILYEIIFDDVVSAVAHVHRCVSCLIASRTSALFLQTLSISIITMLPRCSSILFPSLHVKF